MRLIIALLICALITSVYLWMPYPLPAILAFALAVALFIEGLYTGPARVIRREYAFNNLRQEVLQELAAASAHQPPVEMSFTKLMEAIHRRRCVTAYGGRSDGGSNKAPDAPDVRLLQSVLSELIGKSEIEHRDHGHEPKKRYSYVLIPA